MKQEEKCADCKYHKCNTTCVITKQNTCNGICEISSKHVRCMQTPCKHFKLDQYFIQSW